ncbi:hypothetical protein DL95DRAFT_410511 [Leptodontidium sp. 2 PMI_412]|nr:hypothetical protein DL95DRAFT_410511 [Leptodontidium sp. 2 PMI_412]
MSTYSATSSSYSSSSYPYNGICAIIISWDEDDLDIFEELLGLQAAFQSLNFTSVKMFSIPSKDSFSTLLVELQAQKLKASADGSLLVVYYGGHGRLSTNRRLRLTANREPRSPSIDWISMQAILECADIDVFLILDCCNASAAASSFEQDLEDSPEPTNRFEILAGCGFDSVTRGAGRYSFTNALKTELFEQSQRGGIFSVSQLYQWLHAKMIRQHPSNIPDSNEEEYERCFVAPIYLPRCIDYNHISIPLMKIDLPVLDEDEIPSTSQDSQYSQGFWPMVETSSVYSGETQSSDSSGLRISGPIAKEDNSLLCHLMKSLKVHRSRQVIGEKYEELVGW